MIQGGKGIQDPMGAVPLGREGTGTAQIFRYREPRSAIKDMLPTLRHLASITQRDRAARAKENEKVLKDINTQLTGWEQQDGQELTALRNTINTMYMDLMAEGKQPMSDANFRGAFNESVALVAKTKQDKASFDKALQTVNQMALSGKYDLEAIEEYKNKVLEWAKAPMNERPLFEIAAPVPKEKEIDYAKIYLESTGKINTLATKELGIEDPITREKTYKKYVDLVDTKKILNAMKSAGGETWKTHEITAKNLGHNLDDPIGMDAYAMHISFGDIKKDTSYKGNGGLQFNFGGGGKVETDRYKITPTPTAPKDAKTIGTGQLVSRDEEADNVKGGFQFDVSYTFKKDDTFPISWTETYSTPDKKGNVTTAKRQQQANITIDNFYLDKNDNIVVFGMVKEPELVWENGKLVPGKKMQETSKTIVITRPEEKRAFELEVLDGKPVLELWEEYNATRGGSSATPKRTTTPLTQGVKSR